MYRFDDWWVLLCPLQQPQLWALSALASEYASCITSGWDVTYCLHTGTSVTTWVHAFRPPVLFPFASSLILSDPVGKARVLVRRSKVANPINPFLMGPRYSYSEILDEQCHHTKKGWALRFRRQKLVRLGYVAANFLQNYVTILFQRFPPRQRHACFLAHTV